MAEGGPRGQSAESGYQHQHHHQWRFKRFDAPRYGAESLEFTKFLADRWSRPKHPNKLALGEHGLLRTLIIIQFLRPGRRSSDADGRPSGYHASRGQTAPWYWGTGN